MCSCTFLTTICGDLGFLPWNPRVDLEMSRKKQERGGESTGVSLPSAPPQHLLQGFPNGASHQASLMPEGSESKYYNYTRFPGPGGAARAARHILDPKTNEKKKTKQKKSVSQQNLTLMERTMPESTAPFEGVEINGSSFSLYLPGLCLWFSQFCDSCKVLKIHFQSSSGTLAQGRTWHITAGSPHSWRAAGKPLSSKEANLFGGSQGKLL